MRVGVARILEVGVGVLVGTTKFRVAVDSGVGLAIVIMVGVGAAVGVELTDGVGFGSWVAVLAIT